ncbi:MAG: hypothetical protein GXY13_09980 [Acidimicrobiales bacterium]|nr:hypothetical protein [Acidimicrobiales bacterium]
MTFHDDLPTAGESTGQTPRATPRRSRDPLAGPEGEAMVRRAADMIASARPMPLSSSVMINRDEVLEVLTEAIDRLPDELRQARWLLKEREDFLKRVQAEGDEILDAASAKAEAMVQRTEVVKAAEQRARRIVEAAEDEARRLRMECEDFCDQRLAQFEIVLNRTLRMVHAGRDKLSGTPMTAPGDEPEVTGDVPTVRPDSVPAGGFGRPAVGAGDAGGEAPGDAPSPSAAGPADDHADEAETAFFDQDEV